MTRHARRRIGSSTVAAVAASVAMVVIVSGVITVGGSTGPPRPASAPVAPSAAYRAQGSLAPSGVAPLPAGLARATSIERSLEERGVPLADVHLPDLAAAAADESGPIAPVTSNGPAPMGVADLGIRNLSGRMTPYILNSSSVSGTANLTNAEAVYLDGDSPNSFDLQFNAVATNVTLFGRSSYEFWTQDFATYTPSNSSLSFGDNVWNFSAPTLDLTANSIASHGTHGSVIAPTVYYATGPTYKVTNPFSVTFFLNTTLVGGRPAVYFNFSLVSASLRTAGSFDFVVFQSGTGGSPAPLPAFQVNGTGLDPAYFANDVELVLVGDGGMDTTTFFAINATLAIDFWNASAAAYRPFPSAFSAGDDTGETSNGLDVTFTTTGPTPLAVVSLGPSFVDGLWNVSSDPGRRLVSEVLHPTNAFLFVNPGKVFNQSAAQWVPTMAVGGSANVTFSIPNDGSVFLEAALADYTRATQTINPIANGSTTRLVTLVRTPANGMYTPLIAWGNSQLAAISAASGNGTPVSPYVLYNNQPSPFTSLFATTNDFLYPVFPGLLLIGTSDFVNVTLPSFSTTYPSTLDAALNRAGLPDQNDLQAQFWQVSHLVVKNAPSVSGWLPWTLAGRAAGEVTLWNSSNNLVAGNRFDVEGIGLVLAGGGTNNTVWGNTFLSAPVPGTDGRSLQQPPDNTTGVFEAESGDLLYNNYFELPDPAYTPIVDPASCVVVCRPLSVVDRWNVSLAPAATSRLVLGMNLTGSIIGTWYQGGSYWSNYGSQTNPYGLLPYNDTARIAHFGDYVPLVPFSLYAVTFHESGAPAGTPWSVTALNVTTSTSGTNLTLDLPNGTTPYSVAVPSGYAGPAGGNVTVNGANETVDLTFSLLLPVRFLASGLVVGSQWNVTLQETTPAGPPVNESSSESATIEFNATAGTYHYSVAASGYTASPANGTIVLGTGGLSVAIAFSVESIATFNKTGLPTGTAWTVAIVVGVHSARFTTENPSLALSAFDIPAGAYVWLATSADYSASPDRGSGSTSDPTTTTIAFSVIDGILGGTVNPASGTLLVDGSPVPLLAGTFELSESPGVHAIVVTAAGYAPYYNNVSVQSNSTILVSISLTPLPTSGGYLGISAAGWGLIAALAALAVVALAAALLRRRKSLPPPPRPAPPLAGTATAVPPATTAKSPVAPWEEGPDDVSADPSPPRSR
jgi:thermopsin